MEDIVFDCEVVRVKTMADGSVRLELGMPEGLIVQAAALMQCQQDGIYLHAVLRAQTEDDARKKLMQSVVQNGT